MRRSTPSCIHNWNCQLQFYVHYRYFLEICIVLFFGWWGSYLVIWKSMLITIFTESGRRLYLSSPHAFRSNFIRFILILFSHTFVVEVVADFRTKFCYAYLISYMHVVYPTHRFSCTVSLTTLHFCASSLSLFIYSFSRPYYTAPNDRIISEKLERRQAKQSHPNLTCYLRIWGTK
jgi:hypothetical protein